MNNAWNQLLLAVMIACVLGFAPPALAIDPPHDTVADCNNCHSSHAASYPAQLASLCETCHFEGGTATAVQTHSSLTTDNGYGDWDLDCWACHDPHSQEQDAQYGTTYGKFLKVNLNAQVKEIDSQNPGPYYPPLSILRTVTSSDVEHTSSTTPTATFVDGDGSYTDDICQVCHQSTTNYNTSTTFNTHSDQGADSQPGGNCASCHPHSSGFSAAGGTCTGCHASLQPPGASGEYRRQVTGTGGDFERTSHHVTDGSANEIVTDEDCVVCHNQDNHQTYGDIANVYLNDPDGGTSHTYDGTGSSIKSFCLNCHDADSSTAFDSDDDSTDGYQPFSDGRDPPDIATSWSGSSHDTGLTAEACLGCHGGADPTLPAATYDRNAHGSDLAMLISPTVDGDVVVDGEDSLCFGCHDVDGPATKDIEAMHAGTAQNQQNSGHYANSHHDVQDADQTYSGCVIECNDCHLDVHSITSSSLLIADPDTGDGRVPTAGNSWAGSTWMSEWCLDCHDNSYPAGVSVRMDKGKTQIVDVYTDWIDTRGAQHGADDSGVGSLAGTWAIGDILDCEDCHNLGHGNDETGDVLPNFANLRSVIYDKDNVTILYPDTAWDPLNPEIVRITDPAGNDANTNGKAWCSTCHPNPMGGNKQSGCIDGGCHNHGMGSF
jgi:hypothetical protein